MRAWNASLAPDLLHLQRDRSLQPILAAHAPCLLRVQVEWARGRRCRRLHLGAQRIPRRTKLVGCARGRAHARRGPAAASAHTAGGAAPPGRAASPHPGAGCERPAAGGMDGDGTWLAAVGDVAPGPPRRPRWPRWAGLPHPVRDLPRGGVPRQPRPRGAGADHRGHIGPAGHPGGQARHTHLSGDRPPRWVPHSGARRHPAGGGGHLRRGRPRHAPRVRGRLCAGDSGGGAGAPARPGQAGHHPGRADRSGTTAAAHTRGAASVAHAPAVATSPL